MATNVEAIAEEIKAMTPGDQLRLAADLLDRAHERPDLVVKIAKPILDRVTNQIVAGEVSRLFNARCF